jgi:hypothetical protein
MINPLIDSLSQYTVNELEEKVMDLQRKYFQTHNPDLQLQIANILDIYKNELHTRRAIEAQRQREQLDDGENSLDNLINVS